MSAGRAFGALFVVAVLSSAACTSDESPALAPSPESASSSSPSPEAAVPSRGGSVRVGMIGSPATLDPYSPVASDLTYTLARPVYPSLYALSPDGKPVPSLARPIELVPGGVRITLHRAHWSDGSAITSRDVLASMDRAVAPSGFARVRRARAVSRRVVVLEGTTGNWPRALATLTYVLPDGLPRVKRGKFVGGASWRISGYRPGLKVVYAPNRAAPPDRGPYLRKVTVFFYESEPVLLDALERGDVDVAVPPSTLNLANRLEEMPVDYAHALGWESVWLELRQSLTRRERSAFVAGIDRNALEDGLIRDDGRISRTLHPGPRGTAGPWRAGIGKKSKIERPVHLSIPAGDELLFLLQRTIQIQLSDEKVDVDLIVGAASDFYGPWRSESPAEVSLLRSAGAPGLRDAQRFRRNLTALPLAHVRTYLAWRRGINGLEVNPTFDGPLWNMDRWWRSRT